MRPIQNTIDSPGFRKFVFWLGTVRRLNHFPFVTWSEHNPRVSHDAIDTEILPKVKPGDVGLHCDRGFLSNLFIPGQFKHAWIHVGPDKLGNPQIVEATHEGVLRKSARTPLRTDDLVILRPKLDEDDILAAVSRVDNILNMAYDTSFEFDLREEFHNLDKFHQAFSCIEVVAYAYYPFMQLLGIDYSVHLGKLIIRPDVVVNPAWDVVYSNVATIPVTL